MDRSEEAREVQAPAASASEPDCGKQTKLCCNVFWETDCGGCLYFTLTTCLGFGLFLAGVFGWIALNAFLVRIHLLGYLWSDENSAWPEVGLPHIFAQLVFAVLVLLVCMVWAKVTSVCEQVRREMQRSQQNPQVQDV